MLEWFKKATDNFSFQNPLRDLRIRIEIRTNLNLMSLNIYSNF